MCTIVTASVRPALAALDQRNFVIVLDASLSPAERVREARNVMTDAGQDQSDDAREVVCVCGIRQLVNAR